MNPRTLYALIANAAPIIVANELMTGDVRLVGLAVWLAAGVLVARRGAFQGIT